MMLIPATQQGFYGMQTAIQGMSRAATEIAQFGRTAPSDVTAADTSGFHAAAPDSWTQALIDLKLNQTLFSASARLVDTSDAMVGSLLDVFA